jgi:hypothetical protein
MAYSTGTVAIKLNQGPTKGGSLFSPEIGQLCGCGFTLTDELGPGRLTQRPVYDWFIILALHTK